MLLVTPVPFLLQQVRMSAVKNADLKNMLIVKERNNFYNRQFS